MPIAQSRAPIETMLKKVGATRIVTIDEALEDIVAFTLAG